MDYEHVDFPSAVRKLAARVGITVVEEERASADQDRQHEARRHLLQLHAETAEWFHHNLLKKEFAKRARDYLKNRGIDLPIAKNWQIGFAPDEWDGFSKWARQQGYERRELLQSGLVKLRDESKPQGDFYDRFRARIMFPICNDVGEVIAFSGRTMQKDAETAKYINSPETPLFRKGNVLFGLHRTKRGLIDANCAVVCEGQLDLITLFEAGITNVVAPQGTAFTESQARVLKRFVSEIILCFDADAAGKKAAERSLDALLQNDLIVRVAEMPPGEDPDSFVRSKGKQEFEARLQAARDFFDFWIERESAATDLSSLGAKMELARNLAETVSHVRDPFMRGEVVRKVTARLGVSNTDFEKLLPKQGRPFAVPSEKNLAAPAPAPPHDVAMLCLLALRDGESASFLRQQDWQETLAQTPDTDLLAKILSSDLRPAEPASLNAFMATLTPGEESLVSSWLMQKLPISGSATVRRRKHDPAPKIPSEGVDPSQWRLGMSMKWWNGLRLGVLRRQLEVAQSRMNASHLTTGEELNLQKQILDLTEQLRELSQFSPAPSPEA
jgi:DNA primase